MRREGEEPQHTAARTAVPGDRRLFERIELEAAGDGHARGIGAEVDEPARRFLALHAEPIDVREDATKEGPDHPVARVRARRNPAIDQDGLHAALPAESQQVRPDLGLHHDEDARPDDVERAADDHCPVERKIEDGVHVPQAAPGDLLPGHRRRRKEQPQVRIADLEIFGERPRGQRLADRHGMNPNGLLAVDVEGDRQAAEALPEAPDVLLVADRLIDKVRRDDDKDEQRERAIQQIHGARLL